MIVAKIAKLKVGNVVAQRVGAQICAPTIPEAAEMLSVSQRSAIAAKVAKLVLGANQYSGEGVPIGTPSIDEAAERKMCQLAHLPSTEQMGHVGAQRTGGQICPPSIDEAARDTRGRGAGRETPGAAAAVCFRRGHLITSLVVMLQETAESRSPWPSSGGAGGAGVTWG